MRPTTRTLVVAALLVMTAAGLTGCSPEQEGVSAVTVDRSGQVLVLVKTCDAELDEIQLSRVSAGPADAEDLSTFGAELDEDSEDTFVADVDVAELERDDLYEVDPAATSQDQSFGVTRFSVAALRDLEPGEVLAGATPQRLSEDDFLDATCGRTGAPDDVQATRSEESAVRTLVEYAVAVGHAGWNDACGYVDRERLPDDCVSYLQGFAPVAGAARDALRSFDEDDVQAASTARCGYHFDHVPAFGAATVVWADDGWVVESTRARKVFRVPGRLTTARRLARYDGC